MTGSPTDVVGLIALKRDGGALTGEQITDLVAGYVAGRVPDSQMAAWLMAVVWRGMTEEETFALTTALAAGGARLRLRTAARFVVDKHSTGGVGDKTTLVVGPLVAAAGVPVAKMSGRSLGFAGGTLDKLESFTGIRLRLDDAAFRDGLARVGIALGGQSADLAPGDKAVYTLRDLTATVESIPLIAASVMSKKLAAGASGVVLDVKAGRGAFCPTVDQASELARLMVAIGQRAGVATRAVVSDMDQPLGYAIGNSLEVAEAIAALRGEPVPGLVDLSITVATLMVGMARPDEPASRIERELRDLLATGRAVQTFRDWITHQGGNPRQVDDPRRLPRTVHVHSVTARTSGWVAGVDARALGGLACRLGAGRSQPGATVDHRVGLVLRRRIGDEVRSGQTLADVHLPTNDAELVEQANTCVRSAFAVTAGPVTRRPVVLHVR